MSTHQVRPIAVATVANIELGQEYLQKALACFGDSPETARRIRAALSSANEAKRHAMRCRSQAGETFMGQLIRSTKP